MDSVKDNQQLIQNSCFFSAFMKKHWLAVLCLLIVAVKYFLIQAVPLKAFVYNVHDHRMMVDIAANILDGDWLGRNYISRYLAKGCGYPLLIAVQHLLGLTLHQMAWLLYSSGCLLMAFALRPIVKNRLFLLLIFSFLLFCPDYDMNMVIIYRTWVQGWQFLFIYSSVIAIFLRRDDLKQIALWSVPGSIGTVFYWHSFENSFWLLALYFGTAGIIALFSFLDKEKWQRCAVRSAVILVPLLLVLASSHVISLINYQKYGFYGTSILKGTYFSSFIKNMYSIKPASDNYSLPVPVPHETLKRMYDISPELQKHNPALAASVDNWKTVGRFPNDKDVEGGFLYWAFLWYFENRSFAEQEQIFKQVSRDIRRAFKNGTLEKRTPMPNVIIPPWRHEFLPALLRTTPEFIARIKDSSDLSFFNVVPDWLNGQDEEKAGALHGVLKFSRIYRDSCWINKEHTPISGKTFKLERKLVQLWMWWNPFLFYLAVFSLTAQIILWCWTGKKEMFYLTCLPLSVLGGTAVLIAGFIYIHVSSFDTTGYLYPARQMMQLLIVTTVVVFGYSLFSIRGLGMLESLRKGGKEFLRSRLFYGLLLACVIASSGCWALSRCLDIKEPYKMEDYSLREAKK